MRGPVRPVAARVSAGGGPAGGGPARRGEETAHPRLGWRYRPAGGRARVVTGAAVVHRLAGIRTVVGGAADAA